MALGDPYATLPEFKSRFGLTDTIDDARLSAALVTASRGIDKCAGRQFNDAGTASPRLYPVDTCRWVDIDDFSTTTGLVIEVDPAGAGDYSDTWSSADYELHPLNGNVDGEPGWPYSQIRAVSGRRFPSGSPGLPPVRGFERAPVRVTARWGWAAVPAPIKEATLIIASEIFRLKDAPFGVMGFSEWGPVRVRKNPVAYAMVAPYERYPVLVG